MRIVEEDKAIEVKSEIIRTKYVYLTYHYLNKCLVPKLVVPQMNDPFEMQFFYSKGTIENRLNQSNSRSGRDVSNSGVTESSLKFNWRSAIYLQNI